jgi:hypothetical protein
MSAAAARFLDMGLHLEYRDADGRYHRASASDQLAHAVRQAMSLTYRPILILDAAGDPIQHGAGHLKAAVLRGDDVIETPAEPAWWQNLSGADQASLLASEGVLTAPLVAAVAHAGGAPIAAYWNGALNSSAGFRVPTTDEQWLLAEGARRFVQG